MNIDQVRVQNYKSIRDTGWIDIEEDLTTLVGANEAGKTNVLEALSKLKDQKRISESNLCRYRDNYPDDFSEIPIVSVQVTGYETHLFRYVGEMARNSNSGDSYSALPEVEIIRYADGTLRISEGQFTDMIGLSKMNELDAKLSSNLYKIINYLDIDNIDDIIEGRKGISQGNINNDEIIEMIENINLRIRERNLQPPSPTQPIGGQKSEYKGLADLRAKLRQLVESEVRLELTPEEWAALPEFKFFDSIEPIPEGCQRDELDDDGPYAELLAGEGLDSESLAPLSLHDSLSKRDEVNDDLTSKFNDNWQQADVRFELQSIDDTITIRIFEEKKDEEEEVRTIPSERSQGFRWYLAFFCHLIARSDGDIEDSVILLDDPGAYLHPEGHKDLKSALSSLAGSNQIIYSTHSPYMIKKDHLNSIRTVRHIRQEDVSGEAEKRDVDPDEIELGTMVTRVRGVDSHADDSLAAVRTALGATFSDSLFTSKYTILVEGHDDRMYLRAMSDLLNDHGRTTLLDDATITDCGGASKVDYLTRIVDGENYNYAVLLDDDEAGRDAKDELEDSGIPETNIHSVSDFMTDTDGSNVTIEDLFSVDLFCDIAAAVHTEDGLDKDDFVNAYNPPNDGIVDELDGRLKGARDWTKETADDDDDGEQSSPSLLRKVEIARRITKRVAGEDADDIRDETLDRFETLIKALNASLDDDQPENEIAEARNEIEATD